MYLINFFFIQNLILILCGLKDLNKHNILLVINIFAMINKHKRDITIDKRHDNIKNHKLSCYIFFHGL